MNSPYKPRKRNKRSKFDPYLSDIAEYLSMGMTIRGITEKLELIMDDYVDESALYHFIRSRELRCLNYPGGKNRDYEPPICSECKKCYEILNTHEQKTKVCRVANRMISQSCKTSPDWCEKRKGALLHEVY